MHTPTPLQIAMRRHLSGGMVAAMGQCMSRMFCVVLLLLRWPSIMTLAAGSGHKAFVQASAVVLPFDTHCTHVATTVTCSSLDLLADVVMVCFKMQWD